MAVEEPMPVPSPESAEEGDRQLLTFVVDKVSAGASAFKANKLPQILAALVREEFMQSAVNATKKALDPNLRGISTWLDSSSGGRQTSSRHSNMKMRG